MKQEIWDILSFILRVIIVFGILFFVFAFMQDYMTDSMESQKQKDTSELTPICEDRCNRFDMVFYEIANDGWLYHCWCIDNNKPFQVATLKPKRITE